MRTHDGALFFASVDIDLITVEHGFKYGKVKEKLMQRFSWIYCQILLKEAGGKIAVAAKLAGTDRSRFKQMMRSAGVTLRPTEALRTP